eukprot:325746-Chlamydomonas_euryale.AAC.1
MRHDAAHPDAVAIKTAPDRRPGPRLNSAPSNASPPPKHHSSVCKHPTTSLFCPANLSNSTKCTRPIPTSIPEHEVSIPRVLPLLYRRGWKSLAPYARQHSPTTAVNIQLLPIVRVMPAL